MQCDSRVKGNEIISYIFIFTTILQADSSYEVLCQVIGAAPAPEISWTLTSAHGISRTLAAGPPQLSARGNLSTSVLELAVTSAEHGSELSCSARVGEAGLFPEVNITRLLAVSHPPRVRVTIVGEVTRLVGAEIDLIYPYIYTHPGGGSHAGDDLRGRGPAPSSGIRHYLAISSLSVPVTP